MGIHQVSNPTVPELEWTNPFNNMCVQCKSKAWGFFHCAERNCKYRNFETKLWYLWCWFGVDSFQFDSQFPATLPWTYKLNYTIADGCNPPKTVQVTVKAQCITQMTTPSFIRTATTVGYYCQGNPSSSAEEANGGFQV